MDRISLRDVRAYGRHGAEPSERATIGALELQISADVDLRRAAQTDDLRDTVDYAALHDTIVEVVAATSYALLERLADDVLAAIFQDRRIAAAEVTIAKPARLDGATPSVTLRRANPRFEA
ncbi:MAG: dihydroneopterin aldolase [Candidatus Eremiobacteraeota bacterium]|nr:dihydroneopterin aldolase [Candidatus Eremiobacteraeota bacterium]MBV9056270.1 dihydroneopterin aldolase [Candidatus Eremiobacteraeota bacterium]MBV9698565.1 dihydroneopterin aldolase [Candidatus Eremiobacteraeota bacterium]